MAVYSKNFTGALFSKSESDCSKLETYTRLKSVNFQDDYKSIIMQLNLLYIIYIIYKYCIVNSPIIPQCLISAHAASVLQPPTHVNYRAPVTTLTDTVTLLTVLRNVHVREDTH